MIYALIDGKWHLEVQAPDGVITTECGLEIPYGSEWTRDLPEKVCGKCVPPKKKAA
jgi:hypothetical protein